MSALEFAMSKFGLYFDKILGKSFLKVIKKGSEPLILRFIASTCMFGGKDIGQKMLFSVSNWAFISKLPVFILVY
jgi:hypothetical protein